MLYEVITGPLARLSVSEFVDEVSRDTPAPGGGSIAALAGALGAALASMVANLSIGKSEFDARVITSYSIHYTKLYDTVAGRRSVHDSLFDERVATFEDDAGAYRQDDASGFIRLNALRIRMAARRKGK